MKDYIGKIKVASKVKPLKTKDRIAPALIEGENYYISFGNNNVYSCKLVKILTERNMVNIEIRTKPKSKKGYKDLNGEISHDWKSAHTVYMDEIGNTPENAVKNTVTL